MLQIWTNAIKHLMLFQFISPALPAMGRYDIFISKWTSYFFLLWCDIWNMRYFPINSRLQSNFNYFGFTLTLAYPFTQIAVKFNCKDNSLVAWLTFAPQQHCNLWPIWLLNMLHCVWVYGKRWFYKSQVRIESLNAALDNQPPDHRYRPLTGRTNNGSWCW